MEVWIPFLIVVGICNAYFQRGTRNVKRLFQRAAIISAGVSIFPLFVDAMLQGVTDKFSGLVFFILFIPGFVLGSIVGSFFVNRK